MKIKICGLSRMEDIESVNAVGPDYIGFVFAKSRRQVSVSQAERLAEALLPSVQRVGVFVDEQAGQIVDIVRRGIVDMVQLHGKESTSYVAELKRQISCPVIKAIRMDQEEGTEITQTLLRYESAGVDYFLFDNGPGGTGESFFWSTIPDTKVPYLLAGGIGLDNAAAAAKASSAFALDVSSGAETDGKKDAEKIRRLVELVHSL